MIQAADLPDAIPLFPLPGALLLPRARLPLQIFEPRYLAMLDDVLKTQHRLIGMIQPFDRRDELYKIGCAGRVTSFAETEDGRYMITLSGVSRFRLSGEVEGFTPYRRGRISWEGFGADLGAAESDETCNRQALVALLARFFEARDLSTDWEAMQSAEDELLINSLSILCPFEPEDKQALLEAPTLKTRRETLVALLEFALAGNGEERLQ